MRISIITLFPAMFDPILNTSILKRAQSKGKVEFELINLRDFGGGKHQIVDDRPYGGGAGMVLKADILTKALKSIQLRGKTHSCVILASAAGIPYKQAIARNLSKLDHIIIVCGHYEGVDQRFIDKYVDMEVSIGDYILTGGEIPAMIIADSIVRLIPGVLTKPEAVVNESFSNLTLNAKPYTLLEGPQYTRPLEFKGDKVPDILISGNHGEIAKWREEKSRELTTRVRPDLIIQKD